MERSYILTAAERAFVDWAVQKGFSIGEREWRAQRIARLEEGFKHGFDAYGREIPKKHLDQAKIVQLDAAKNDWAYSRRIIVPAGEICYNFWDGENRVNSDKDLMRVLENEGKYTAAVLWNFNLIGTRLQTSDLTPAALIKNRNFYGSMRASDTNCSGGFDLKKLNPRMREKLLAIFKDFGLKSALGSYKFGCASLGTEKQNTDRLLRAIEQVLSPDFPH